MLPRNHNGTYLEVVGRNTENRMHKEGSSGTPGGKANYRFLTWFMEVPTEERQESIIYNFEVRPIDCRSGIKLKTHD